MVGILQSTLVLVFDMLGSRGVANLLVYVVPGITLEIGMLLFSNYISSKITAFIAGGIANVTGAFIIGILFLRLSLVPITVSLVVAFISGGIGGLIGNRLY